jgi:hypothetical protein
MTPPFLEGFVEQREFASTVDLCIKTIQRYRQQPDGLPFLEFGGRIYIGPADEARAWLLRRVRRPNPRRSATGGRA